MSYLFDVYPHLLEFWILDKNKADPLTISQYSENEYWFKCINNKHELLIKPNNLSSSKSGNLYCKYCHSILETNPEVIPFIHPTKNTHIDFNEITYKSSLYKICWLCPNNPLHEWEQSPNNWIKKGVCPFCINHKINETNCIVTTCPQILDFWHPFKNEIDITQVARKSSFKIWLRCPLDDSHEWQKEPCNIVKLHCHFCISIITTHPQFLEFWDFEKNNLQPEYITRGSSQKIWWKCQNNHSWYCSLNSYKKELMRCLQCERNEHLKNNCLAITHPHLINEWHEDNILTPYDVTYGSEHKIKWKCIKNINHFYLASPYSRIGKKSNCPYCSFCVSKGETELFDFLNLSIKNRNNRIIVNNRVFFPDYVDFQNKIIIEFDGDRIHGNPEFYNAEDIHDRIKKTYGYLYNKTIEKKEYLESYGWIVISIWESEWNKAKKSILYKP